MYKGLLQLLQPDFQRNIPIFLIIWVRVVAADLLVYSVLRQDTTRNFSGSATRKLFSAKNHEDFTV